MVSSEENLELCMVCEKAEESSELGLVLQSDETHDLTQDKAISRFCGIIIQIHEPLFERFGRIPPA